MAEFLRRARPWGLAKAPSSRERSVASDAFLPTVHLRLVILVRIPRRFAFVASAWLLRRRVPAWRTGEYAPPARQDAAGAIARHRDHSAPVPDLAGGVSAAGFRPDRPGCHTGRVHQDARHIRR
jgi:hypothetical protein